MTKTLEFAIPIRPISFRDRTIPLERVASFVARLAARTMFGRCWEWQGATRNGYPHLSLAGVPEYGHRVIWTLISGDEPVGLDVCHTCDNPPCWRPGHLFAGTRLDNVTDCLMKGRASMPPPPVKGFAHHFATLSDAQVEEVRARATESQRALAAEFGVAQSTIGRLIRREVRP